MAIAQRLLLVSVMVPAIADSVCKASGGHMIEGLEIAEDDLTSADVRALVALHLGGMHAESPACKVLALPVGKLRQPGVTFYIARIRGQLAAMGAILHLDAAHGELKSMRAAPEWRGRGAGAQLYPCQPGNRADGGVCACGGAIPQAWV